VNVQRCTRIQRHKHGAKKEFDEILEGNRSGGTTHFFVGDQVPSSHLTFVVVFAPRSCVSIGEHGMVNVQWMFYEPVSTSAAIRMLQDWKGQQLAERLYQIILILSGVRIVSLISKAPLCLELLGC